MKISIGIIKGNNQSEWKAIQIDTLTEATKC